MEKKYRPIKSLSFLIFYLFFLICCFFLLTPKTIYASIIISEVYPAPADNLPEWIEIFNDSNNQSVDLTNYFLKDQLSTPSNIYQFQQTIKPLEYLVIELPSIKLNNSADGVTLINQSGEIIDQMSYQNSNSDQSWARESGQFILTEPSPGESNFTDPNPAPNNTLPSPSPTATTPTPSPTPNQNYLDLLNSIQISEFMACPETNDTEWIEFFNNSDQRIDLTNWKIFDSNDNSKTISQLQIDPFSFAVFSWSGSLLNNSGDSILLSTPNEHMSEAINYQNCQKGNSLIKYNNTWTETTTPTKNSSNIFSTNHTVAITPTPNPENNLEIPQNQNKYLKSENLNSNSVLATKNNDLFLSFFKTPSIKIATFSGQILGESINSSSSSHLQPNPEFLPNKQGFFDITGGGLFLFIASSMKIIKKGSLL